MQLSDVKDVATLVGVAVGALSLLVAARNLAATRKSNQARFWLDLRTHFVRHDGVHRKLRPGGSWANPGTGPETPEEWADVEAYMGLFEQCERFLEAGLIDEETFTSLYRYRLVNLVANERIRTEKLIQRAQGWVDFLRLLQRAGVEAEGLEGPPSLTAPRQA